MRGHMILSHGFDSSPDASKISTLETLARSLGWQTRRPDFRPDDTHGLGAAVVPRMARLRAAIEATPLPPVLVGSSMGAFISALVSLDKPIAGLFLLATPTQIPDYPQTLDMRPEVPAWLIHGWRDTVCPCHGLQAFAAGRRLPLFILDDDHRLKHSMAMITMVFRHSIETLASDTFRTFSSHCAKGMAYPP